METDGFVESSSENLIDASHKASVHSVDEGDTAESESDTAPGTEGLRYRSTSRHSFVDTEDE